MTQFAAEYPPLVHQASNFSKNRVKHLGGQYSRVGVVAGAVVGGDNREMGRPVDAMMAEGVGGNPFPQGTQGIVVGDFSKRDDHL